jgi:hypothetical protein
MPVKVENSLDVGDYMKLVFDRFLDLTPGAQFRIDHIPQHIHDSGSFCIPYHLGDAGLALGEKAGQVSQIFGFILCYRRSYASKIGAESHDGVSNVVKNIGGHLKLCLDHGLVR